MRHVFEVHANETDDLNTNGIEGEERRHRNDRRGQGDRRKRDRRGAANLSHLPLLTEDEIAALLNGAH